MIEFFTKLLDLAGFLTKTKDKRERRKLIRQMREARKANDMDSYNDALDKLRSL